MKLNVADLDAGELPLHQPPVTAPPKPGGIVMLGDSTTAGRRGVVQKVYAQRVQESLQSVGSSLSVHNAGAPSHTTRDAKKRLEHDVLAHGPRDHRRIARAGDSRTVAVTWPFRLMLMRENMKAIRFRFIDSLAALAV